MEQLEYDFYCQMYESEDYETFIKNLVDVKLGKIRDFVYSRFSESYAYQIITDVQNYKLVGKIIK